MPLLVRDMLVTGSLAVAFIIVLKLVVHGTALRNVTSLNNAVSFAVG